MMTDRASAAFVISFGGPEKGGDVLPFLEDVTRGRGIPRRRLEAVAHHYEMIGGASPINAITRGQAEALRNALAAGGTPLPVYVGNRHWHPFLEETLRSMQRDGVRRAVGFITAAHRCEASFERYVRAVENARQKIGPGAPAIDYVEPWFDHPLFIEAIAARIQEVFPGSSIPRSSDSDAWVFTAHSIPCAMAESSAYVAELRHTARLVAERLGASAWDLAYTSRSGAPQDAWLEPDVCGWIRENAKSGVRRILAIPIGFVADHVEVLYDLDIEAKAAAQEAGVDFARAATVGAHPAFARMMAQVVESRLRQPSKDFAAPQGAR